MDKNLEHKSSEETWNQIKARKKTFKWLQVVIMIFHIQREINESNKSKTRSRAFPCKNKKQPLCTYLLGRQISTNLTVN